MSLTEVLPSVQSLCKADKLRLIQLLAQQVTDEDLKALVAGVKTFPVWSPYDAFDAAAVMMKVLEEDPSTP